VRKLAPTALAALLALCCVARADPFETALNAFNAADYATAFSIWWPLARGGDPKSQASLGFMYYSGKGVQRDDQRALRRRYARQNGLRTSLSTS
jgi:uncharacterized protein